VGPDLNITVGPNQASIPKRLDRLRGLLVARADVSRTRLLLFGRSGFAPDLLAAAQTRSNVELIDLERLYEGD